MKTTASAAYADSKPHYELLDGLRGVAALVVVWYHVFEGFATCAMDQRVNHGYLAVDFFFMLSGFVVAYAYDDRWSTSLTVKGFVRRRLIRLHPMVVMGALLGCLTFCLQGGVRWDGTPVGTGALLVALVCSALLLPSLPGSVGEVRGNGEMFPLNGPSWSLFYEYVGNALYALVLRRLGTRVLAGVVVLCGAGLVWVAAGNFSGGCHLGLGWSLGGLNVPGGLLRLLFAFGGGLLLSRVFRQRRVRGAFWLCSSVLVGLLAVPYVGGDGSAPSVLNGLYEVACVAVAFPLVVWAAASGRTTDAFSRRVCRFLGDISFPLYIVHYPFMYLFFDHVGLMKPAEEKLTFAESWPWALAVFAGSVALAWLLLKCYDEPVRRWLTRHTKWGKA